jgi:hypothetical protein
MPEPEPWPVVVPVDPAWLGLGPVDPPWPVLDPVDPSCPLPVPFPWPPDLFASLFVSFCLPVIA